MLLCLINRTALISVCVQYRFCDIMFGAEDALSVELSIGVEPERQLYLYRITCDIETMCECLPDFISYDGDKLKYDDALTPGPVSVASNVPTYTPPKCFISNGDPDALVMKMFTYMEEITEHAQGLMQEEFAHVLLPIWLNQ